jgi:hypothetical protein
MLRKIICICLLLGYTITVYSQELREFAEPTPSSFDPAYQYWKEGATTNDGVIVVNSAIRISKFNLKRGRSLAWKVDPNNRNRYLLIVKPTNDEYYFYEIEVVADGFKPTSFKTGAIGAGGYAYSCWDINELAPPKTNALWYIVPGLGQIELENKPEGFATIAGETLLLGGGIVSSISAKKQLEIMRDVDVSLEDFMTAKNKYNTLKAVNVTCYVGAAALYGFHLYRVYHLSKKAKSKRYASLTPTIMPSSETVAFGLSLNLNF